MLVSTNFVTYYDIGTLKHKTVVLHVLYKILSCWSQWSHALPQGTRVHIPNSKLIKHRTLRDKEKIGSLAVISEAFSALLSQDSTVHVGLQGAKHSTCWTAVALLSKHTTIWTLHSARQNKPFVHIRCFQANRPEPTCPGQLLYKHYSFSLLSLKHWAGRIFVCLKFHVLNFSLHRTHFIKLESMFALYVMFLHWQKRPTTLLQYRFFFHHILPS